MIDEASEIRCGYQVTTKLKKIWNVELELLIELLRVCDKYNLRITMFCGSLLGTIRHKGFIPWDDDMDVAMPRKDYEILMKVASKEFKEPIFFQTAMTDRKFFFGFARLRNSDTTGIITWNQSKDYNNGIYIDIYVLDGLTDNRILFEAQFLNRNIIKQFLSVYYADFSYKSKKPRIVVSLLKKIAHIWSYEKWFDIYTSIVSKYSDTSCRYAIITNTKKGALKYWCYKEDFDSITWENFENIKVPIIKNYDTVLRRCYGEYSNYPPAKERGAWHETMIIFDPEIPYKEYFDRNHG